MTLRKFTYYVIFAGVIGIFAADYVAQPKIHQQVSQLHSPLIQLLVPHLFALGLGLLIAGIPLLYICRKLERKRTKEQFLFHTVASVLNTNELMRPSCRWTGPRRHKYIYEVSTGFHPGVLVNDVVEGRMREQMSLRMGGDVTVDFLHHRGEVTITLREDMPTSIDHPEDLSTRSRSIPYGVTHGMRILAWNPKEISHCLIMGMPNAGKTRALIGMVIEAMRRRYRIIIVDPKRTSFRGFSKLLKVATENDTMAKAIDEVYEEMETRYRNMKAGKTYQEDLKPFLLVVDEYSEFSARMKESWTGKGEHPAIIRFRQIVRLGREAGIHLLVGTQRPDASIMTGEARSNFGLVIALGKLNAQAAQMVGATRRISRYVPGRGLAIYGDDNIEVQVFRTPDPAGKLTAEDERLIAALLHDASQERSSGRSQARASSSQGRSPGDSQGVTAPSGLPEKLSEDTIAAIEGLARERNGDKWALTYSQIAAGAGVSQGAAHRYGSQVRELQKILDEGNEG